MTGTHVAIKSFKSTVPFFINQSYINSLDAAIKTTIHNPFIPKTIINIKLNIVP